jgi:phosphoenolpyruvate synthase/pyruvate phosphate dikinase
MKKYTKFHEEHAISPLTISPNHNAWASERLVKLLDGHRVGIKTFCSHEKQGLSFYADKQAWNDAAEHLIKKIVSHKRFVTRIAVRSIPIAKQIAQLIQKTEIEDLSKWSDIQLAFFLGTTYRKAVEFCVYGYIPVLSDQYFTKYTHLLKQVLKKVLARTMTDYSLAGAMQVLTSPTGRIPSQVARIDLLQLALARANDSEVLKYYHRWFWVEHGHLGPRKPIDSIRSEVRALRNDRVAAQRELFDLKRAPIDLAQRQSALSAALKLTSKERHVFEVARTFGRLKGLRMEILFGVYAEWGRVLTEMATRNHIPKALLYYCSIPELVAWLRQGRKVPISLLKSRAKYCVWVAKTDTEQDILVGKAGRDYIRAHGQEDTVKQKDVLVIHGTVASPGYAEGRVRIVNRTTEIKKVKPGDIMVSVATNPSLLPAMNNAAAFVTDSGGLTSHAAIVAREMKKPCVIGTKIATKVLKDGERVSVDARVGDIRRAG